jgi:hypothetical protein
MCMAVYHMEFASADDYVVCQFFHTLANPFSVEASCAVCHLACTPLSTSFAKLHNLCVWKSWTFLPASGAPRMPCRVHMCANTPMSSLSSRCGGGGSPWSLADPSTEAMPQTQNPPAGPRPTSGTAGEQDISLPHLSGAKPHPSY